jgi:Transglycosylase
MTKTFEPESADDSGQEGQPAPSEDPGKRLRRLTGKDAEEPVEPERLSPNRHPTGTPELTGGWYADYLSGLESPPPETDPPVSQAAPPDESQDAALSQTSSRSKPPSGSHHGRRRTPPPPGSGDTALPERVPERDTGATRVTPAAYHMPPPPPAGRPPGRLSGLSGCGGLFVRMAVLGLFVLVALVIGAASFGVYEYYAVASTLPSVDDLQSRAAQFETTRILDRNGDLLYEILDPNAGRRTYVKLDHISPYMVAATIATEDSQFYSHPGFDPWAILRAIYQNLVQGSQVSGASTITQQIARGLLFTPEEASQRTALRKIREILLAAEITRRYSKDEILELYLNQVYYGNLAYGVEAAAETYFNITADKLTLAQSSFLAGLVQAPSVYDVFTNREVTLNRQRQVLSLMLAASQEQGCIFVSNSPQPICVSPEEAGAAAAELNNYTFAQPYVQIRYPHWVNYIRGQLESLYDPQTIYPGSRSTPRWILNSRTPPSRS